jgi:hypothetical protein
MIDTPEKYCQPAKKNAVKMSVGLTQHNGVALGRCDVVTTLPHHILMSACAYIVTFPHHRV